jgi:hypothetical protein
LWLDDAVWDATTFTKNRDRLLTGDIATAFLREVLAIANDAGVLSNEHFTVDGTLLEAAASQKSCRPRDDDPRSGSSGNADVNFRGETRRNDTHHSTTDPDARLAKKGPGREAKLSYAGHLLSNVPSGTRTIFATGIEHRALLVSQLRRNARDQRDRVTRDARADGESCRVRFDSV